jgi:hypothetical protein
MSVKPQSPPLNPLSIIDRIIADVELTPTQYEEAKTSYESVAEVLQKPGSPIRSYIPAIFPQGSMRMGTTIRPIWLDAFDLDMVCRLSFSGRHHTPNAVFEWIWEALGQDATYREMRQRRNRCIRLIYKGRPFYLDIVPAVPEKRGSDTGSPLYVPDRERKTWNSSHPVGFADDWFKPITELKPRFRLLNTANERQIIAMSASVEPLPEYGAFEKTPLQRIVQVIKFDRDKHFQNDEKHRPSSIILTTLAAHSYKRAVQTEVGSLLEFVIRVVESVPDAVDSAFIGGRWFYSVANPVNQDENFAENWTHEHFSRFKRWHENLMKWLKSIGQSKGKGADVMLKDLIEQYGNERVVKAADSIGTEVKSFHESKRIHVTTLTAGVSSLGVPIRPTINFGSED